ncbi:MAG: hypothetical protein IT376_14490 [Polyangiaceae bacterium]|nr:hypothetical protein [Polyangiaceae bacterium]
MSARRGAGVALFVIPALLGACSEEERAAAAPAAPAAVASASGTLDLELRDSLEIGLELLEDGSLRARVRAPRGFAVAADGAELSGVGRLVELRESEGTLYTARFSGAPVGGGPCGAEPVSLALSLHRRGDNAFVAGSLTPYCGADRWHGRPARTPLRLTGELPALAAPR